ncbi:carbon starvation protein A [Dehalococcoidia bacterium]|nr:carbon starvation protein A [Dehalococcoidia bacterium]MCL0098782.1 carbon starvation protein A [Dehalococcoidia bacterium]
MSAIWLLVVAIAAFVVGYTFYGSYVIKKLGGADPTAKTPAHAMRDEVDYVPAPGPVLMGHHFASIAGAGPIVGPIVAAVFGWIPVFLWIVLGGIFIGAVHDAGALYTSVRHRAKSIAEILGENIGISGKKLFAAFAWLTVILVLAVFAVVLARTFAGTPSVATAAILFIVLAIFFGYAVHRRGAPLAVSSVVGVALLALCVWLGTLFPISLPVNVWIVLLLAYALVAASLPVWLILQPRDYLESFLLYGFLAAALIGILATNPAIKLTAFTGFQVNLGYLFPMLFVTVACGAISGFHSLVSSGTTAKQVSRETHIRPIGYGGMLLECLLAVIALTTAAYLLMGDYTALLAEKGWGGVFSTGIGSFLTGIGVPLQLGEAFAGLVLAAFALTTLDTATRLCRFMLQELTEKEEGKPSAVVTFVTNRYVAGLICVVLAGWLALGGGWRILWPLFGSANQLMATLALLAVAVWLTRMGRDNKFVLYPMVFMLAVTMTALVFMFFKALDAGIIAHMIIVVALFALAIVLVYLAITRLGAAGKRKPARG